MDFETQVEALTGLAIGTGVTTAQLTQFLTDGVFDVTNRCTSINPQESINFLKGEESDTQGDLGEGIGDIVSVIRESGTSSDWRSCRFVPNDLQSRVTDVNSIHYSSKFNPAYLVDNKGKVLVYPAPSAGGANSYKVYYVNNVPVDGSYAALEYDASTIGYFPKNKVYLVVMYASIKSIDHLVESLQSMPSNIADVTLGVPVLPAPPTLSSTSITFSETAPTYISPVLTLESVPSISDLSISVVVPIPITLSDTSISFTQSAPSYIVPVATLENKPSISDLIISAVSPVLPTLSDTSISFSETAPTYTVPVSVLEDKPSISDLSISVTPPIIPALSDSSVTFTQAVPTYVPPVTSPDFSDADTWINTEEDSEMSAARVQVINTQLQKYTSDIQNSLNTFNEQNASYQIEFQKATQNAQLSSSDDSQKIQSFQADVASYQAQISKEVQEYTNNFNKELQLWQTNRTTSTQKYQADIQNNLNLFNKENAEYQIEFQKSTQNAQLESKDDDQKIQKYQTEISNYQAAVSKEVQEYTNTLNKELQLWQANRQTVIQKYQADLTNALNSFNKENTEYQMEFQRAQQNAQFLSKDDDQVLQKYQIEVSSYQNQISKEVQEYTNNLNKEIKLWEVNRTTSTQKYQTDLQDALNSFNKENAEYQIEFQKASADAQLSSKDEDQLLQKYQIELAAYSANVNQEIQAVTKLATDIQQFTAEMQKAKLDVELYMQRSMKLQKDYDTAFQVMYPSKQQQGGK